MKIIILNLIIINSLFTQIKAEAESNKINLNEYSKFVFDSHPLSKNALLEIQSLNAKLLKSKGNFDPKSQIDFYQKYYDDKTYFSNGDAALKIPIWWGPEFKLGLENNTGVFLNPQNSVPKDGLFYFGVNLPLGRGLIYDNRRFEQEEAELWNSVAQMESNLILNELNFRLKKRFFDWYYALLSLQILNQTSENAYSRLEFVKRIHLAGDAPAIDTLEAFVQYKNRVIDGIKYSGKYLDYSIKAIALLSFSDRIKETQNLIPEIENEIIDTNQLNFTIDNIERDNPQILLLKNEKNVAVLSNDLAKENFKPMINLSYNFLTNGENVVNPDSFRESNYKWNVNFQFPLFLRKERGEYQLTKIKIDQVENKIQDKIIEIRNKLMGIKLEVLALIPSVSEYKNLVKDYQTLLDAEFIKFQEGDSSLFKINVRENKLLEIKLKSLELEQELKLKLAEFYYQAGIVN